MDFVETYHTDEAKKKPDDDNSFAFGSRPVRKNRLTLVKRDRKRIRHFSSVTAVAQSNALADSSSSNASVLDDSEATLAESDSGALISSNCESGRQPGDYSPPKLDYSETALRQNPICIPCDPEPSIAFMPAEIG